MKFQSDALISSASVEIINDSNSFSNDNTQIAKIWLYRDNPPYLTDSSSNLGPEDIFLSSIDRFSSNQLKASLDSVEFVEGTNFMVLLYDIGLKASFLNSQNNPNILEAQINNVSSSEEGENVIFGGLVPAPRPFVQASVSENSITIDSVSVKNFSNQSNGSSTFNVTIQITNNSISRNITNIGPRFYSNSIGGSNITSEFNFILTKIDDISLNGIDPGRYSIGSLETKLFEFDVTHVSRKSSGITFVDANIIYSGDAFQSDLSFGRNVVLQRYQTDFGNFNLIANSADQIILPTISETQFSTIPSYIENLEFGDRVPQGLYVDGDAVPQGSRLYITFANRGLYVDESSFNLLLNGTNLIRDSDSGYSFDNSTGVLTVRNLGSQNGTLTFNGLDDVGNSLETFVTSFLISNDIELHTPYFYPNPYNLGSEDLILGFSLTQPADEVKLYIFSYLGSTIIWHLLCTFVKLL